MLKCLNAKTIKWRGFTLAEVMVSIFIIVLMSGIIFANYRVGGRQFALQRSANKLAQDIRRTQQMAMGAVECPVANCCGVATQTIPPRYGVQFINSSPDYYSYIIFADCNDNGKYEPSSNVVETINFEGGVRISDLSIGDPPTSKTQLYITFKPPDPTIDMRTPADETSTIARIQLINPNNQTKTITVNSAGLIEIQ